MDAGNNVSLLAVLDDDESIRHAVQDLVESEGLSALCFDSAEEFLDSGIMHKAACLIVDVRMPGMCGFELHTKLKSERCQVPTIFMTGLGDIPMAVKAMQGGAVDFLTKPLDESALLNSIGRAIEQDRKNRRDTLEQVQFAARYETLTPREREVLALLLRGLLNKQAAYQLGITEYTVQVHRAHVMKKMQADSFATLVKLGSKFAFEQQSAD
jgi:FixJ family two-component response regulator